MDNDAMKLDALLARIQKLEHELERVKAVDEIQRLMGNYMTNHIKTRRKDVISEATSWKFFANRPDSSIEVSDYGIYVGIENIRKLYEFFSGGARTEGLMFEHNLSSPQIVVAEDGMTARGVWHCPGHETGYSITEGDAAKLEANWAWGRVAADFIKEDGQWKIWHYHWYSLLRCPFYKSWVDYQPPKEQNRANSPAFAGREFPKPSLPTSYCHEYSVDEELEAVPPCPQPYETWTEDRFPV